MLLRSPWHRCGTGSALVLALLVGAPVWGQETRAGPGPAVLVVRLPEDARLQVDGSPTARTGAVRRFTSPSLEPGRRFVYTLSAVWEPNNYTTITRTRQAYVRAGQETTVDLTEADPARPDDIVIRYVPTPPQVVEAMLKLAGVGKDDVVYDLGCGDGRIVITAVGAFGARRGVGVDLDPERLRESRANARRAGVEGRVEFRQGDVLKIKDLSSASVVTLYLGEPVNLRLRPVLQKTLRPGARVVSHRFTMGDWKPDRTETIIVGGEEYQLHLWTIGKR
jgi:uncharacterized protein (TIGR03000 family)